MAAGDVYPRDENRSRRVLAYSSYLNLIVNDIHLICHCG